MKEKILKITEEFNKIPKKYWTTLSLTGEDHDIRRSKPGPYLKTAAQVARLLGMKTVVEIGATRLAFANQCLEYYESEMDGLNAASSRGSYCYHNIRTSFKYRRIG